MGPAVLLFPKHILFPLVTVIDGRVECCLKPKDVSLSSLLLWVNCLVW